MRLELMTYALRKRGADCVSLETEEGYVDSNSSVAPKVALKTRDSGCVELMLPDDLSELIQLWPKLDEAIRSALLAVARVGEGKPRTDDSSS